MANSIGLWIEGGSVTSPAGFMAGTAACGLKSKGKDDLLVLVSEHPCSAAGVFTRNQVVAAPVVVDRECLASDPSVIRAVVANSGVANACTGEAGLNAARETQAIAAEHLGVEPPQVLVLSTGLIGVPLPMEVIKPGTARAFERLSREEGPAAARAIMTTDTQPKHRALKMDMPAGQVTLGGIAKGAGMIHPNMATMLAVVTTDAALSAQAAQEMLQRVTDRTFNCITVDGDTSTNDAVLLLANGAAGVAPSGADLEIFETGLTDLCRSLAKSIVRDGEGATKFVTLTVQGAADADQARRVGRTVASSPLVKTALHGGDPNWGRILAAAGRSGVPLAPERLALWVADGEREPIQLVEAGAPLRYPEEAAAQAFSKPEVDLRLDLGLGESEATVWTCDLSHEYVTINSHYRT